jgi:hypothetical protein
LFEADITAGYYQEVQIFCQIEFQSAFLKITEPDHKPTSVFSFTIEQDQLIFWKIAVLERFQKTRYSGVILVIFDLLEKLTNPHKSTLQ